LQPHWRETKAPSLYAQLDSDTFDFIERNLITGPIIQLRRARTFMRRDRLRIFDRAAVPQISRDARRAKSVAAGAGIQRRIFDALRRCTRR